MVIAGYIIEFLFSAAGLVPAGRTARVAEQGVQWNYTTVLNIVLLLMAQPCWCASSGPAAAPCSRPHDRRSGRQHYGRRGPSRTRTVPELV